MYKRYIGNISNAISRAQTILICKWHGKRTKNGHINTVLYPNITLSTNELKYYRLYVAITCPTEMRSGSQKTVEHRVSGAGVRVGAP